MQAPAFPGGTAPGRVATATTDRRGEDAETVPDEVKPRGLSILARLRRDTAPAHEHVEARLFPSALTDAASYRRMLTVLLALHEPLEHEFANWADTDAFAGLGIDLAERRKATGLRDDLARLDVLLDQPAGEAPTAATPPVRSLSEALGAFYVLEGSTLGGRFLLTEVQERLGDVPTCFFSGYGDRTAKLWKQTRTALVRGVTEAPDPADAEDALVAGAGATFARLDALLDDAGWAAV